MSNIAKLKKKAAELEAKKQYDKALEIYEQVLNTARSADEERDIALYNRVGDLHYRIGNNEQAINYYEQAADFYAEGGLFNNAIALCNKILRYSPGRTVIYYKLGLISARKGFNSDAKQNFLEYADRMQRVGKMDEAFSALKEFADLCPGQDDVRLMLAEQLAKASRKDEALEQLELLYDTLQEEGRTTEATATLDRMKALDPAFKPRRSITPKSKKRDGLVFLDLDFEDQSAPRPASSKRTPVAPQPAAEVTAPEVVEPSPAAAPEGFELTSLAEEATQPEAIQPIDIEPTTAEATQPSGEFAGERAEESAQESKDESSGESSEESNEGLEPTAKEPTPATNELVFITPLDPEPLVPEILESAPREASYRPEESSYRPDDDFIDLGQWLEANRTPQSTRMVAHDEEPENDEQKDFGEMLDKFKAGISKNVDEEDFESHYDLGIAFREMGLLDEAIGSFQKASRGAGQRVRASEAIGQCFMDKGEAGVTITVLERLVRDPQLSDAQLVGVLYLLGRASESLSRYEQASAYYQRVLAVQIGFRDAADRLSSLAQASR